MSPPHLHHGVRVVLDFVLYRKLVRSTNTFYAVSVRRCRILPTASFRFRLTTDTLAVRLMVPTTKPIADFHRQVTAHVGRIAKGRSQNRFFNLLETAPWNHDADQRVRALRPDYLITFAFSGLMKGDSAAMGSSNST